MVKRAALNDAINIIAIPNFILLLVNLSKDKKILIHGGAGGIGSIAIQLAKHVEAYVATTVSTNHKQFAQD